jgi:hypothetical protein
MTKEFNLHVPLALVILLSVSLVACLDPVAEQTTNNQTSGSNNQTSGSNNTVTDPKLNLFRSADDLVMHFTFRTHAGPQVPNEVESLQRLAFNVKTGETLDGWLVERPSGSIGFVQDDLAPFIAQNQGLSIELRMQFINFDAFDLVNLQDNQGNTVFRLTHPTGQGALTAEWTGRSETFANVLQIENPLQLTVTIDEHAVRIYVDGILIEALSGTTALIDALIGIDNIIIGESSGYAKYDTVAIYGRALTPAEVAMHAIAEPDPLVAPRQQSLWVEHFQESPTIDQMLHAADQLTFNPNDERNGLYFDLGFEDANALIRFHVDQARLPDAPQHYAQARFSTAPRPEGEWSLEFFPMLQPWVPSQTTWVNFAQDQPWSVEGGIGDVGPSLGKYEDSGNGNTHPRKYFVDVTDVLNDWKSDDNGLLLQTINGRGDVSTTRHPPALTVLGLSEPPVWTAPTVQRRASNTNCQFTPEGLPDGVKMEVWREEHLIGVTSGVSLEVPDCVDFNQFSVSFIDLWGNHQREAQSLNR